MVALVAAMVSGCTGAPSAAPTVTSSSTPGSLALVSTSPATAFAATPAASAPPVRQNGLPAAGTVVATIPLPNTAGGLVVGQSSAWAWDDGSGTLVRLDPASGHVTATRMMPGDAATTPYGNPKDVAVGTQGVWVTDVTGDGVALLDTKTGAILDHIDLKKVGGSAGIVSPFGLALDDGTLWVSDFDRGVVLGVDTRTKQVVTTIPVDHPEHIAVAPGAVWVVEHRLGNIARIDPATNTLVATVAIPGSGSSGVCGMCIDFVRATAGAVWVPLDLGNAVVRIDPATNAVAARIEFDRAITDLSIGNDAVWAVGVTPPSSAPCHDPGSFVARIDPATNTPVASLAVDCATAVATQGGEVWSSPGMATC